MTLPQLMRLAMLIVLTLIAIINLHDLRALVQTSALFAWLVH